MNKPMGSKYIIKNCPACRQYQVGIYTCDDLYDCDLQHCQDCTDCVMKQIVELCVNEINYSDRWSESRAFAKELLDTIAIQEVE